MKSFSLFILIFVANHLTYAEENIAMAKLKGSADHLKKHNLEPKGFLASQMKLTLTIVTGSLANSELVAKYYSTFNFLTISNQTEMHLKLKGTVNNFHKFLIQHFSNINV